MMVSPLNGLLNVVFATRQVVVINACWRAMVVDEIDVMDMGYLWSLWGFVWLMHEHTVG